jgi:hypothetical protein
MTPQPIEGVMAERTAEEIIVAELSGLLHSPHGASPTAQAILAALADAGLHLCREGEAVIGGERVQVERTSHSIDFKPLYRVVPPTEGSTDQ